MLTGRGADIIIIDDPLKPDEASSDARRQGCNEWYDHTLYSRQNDKRCGAIIIMQRLHEDDLVGNFDHKALRSAQPSRGEGCFMLTDSYGLPIRPLRLGTTTFLPRIDR